MDVLFFLLLLCCLWVYVYVPCHNLQMFGKNNVNPLSFFQATRSTNLRQWALRMPRGHLRSGNEGEGRSGFRGYFSYCYVWVHPSVIYKFEIRQVFHTVFGVSVGKTECWAGRMWSTLFKVSRLDIMTERCGAGLGVEAHVLLITTNSERFQVSWAAPKGECLKTHVGYVYAYVSEHPFFMR